MAKNLESIKPFGTYSLSTGQKIVLLMIKSRFLLRRRGGRKIATKLWTSYNKTPGVEIYDLKRWNLRWRLNFKNNGLIENVFLLYGKYDKSEIDIFKSRMQAHDVFADVGANMGYWALRLSQYFPKANFLAFEPNPIMFDRLKENIELNSLGDRVIAFSCAVSDKSGVANLQIGSDENSAFYAMGTINESFSKLHEKKYAYLDKEAFKVKTETLKNCLKKSGLEKIDAIKLDVEGHEDKAFMPYLKNMPKENWPHTILIEYEHSQCWEDDMIGFLQENGYQILFKKNMNIILGN